MSRMCVCLSVCMCVCVCVRVRVVLMSIDELLVRACVHCALDRLLCCAH